MKKKLWSYLTLLTLVGSFLLSPLNALSAVTPETPSEKTSTVLSETQSETELRQAGGSSITNSSSTQAEVTEKDAVPTQAETTTESLPRGPTAVYAKAKEIGNIITKATITDSSGRPLQSATQWNDIQLNFEFALPNNGVAAGDTSTLQLPAELRFLKNQTFDVKNATGDLIATAVIDQASKTLKLTYTDFVEAHSDITGSLYVTVRVDTTVVKEAREIPLTLDINGTPLFIGKLQYGKASDDPNERFTKYAWFQNEAGTEINYVLRVNGSRANYTNAVVEDSLRSDGLTYDKNSFRIRKGIWQVGANGSFELQGAQDVTAQVAVAFTADARGFRVALGNLNGEGYQISYKVKANHAPLSGETFRNYARLTGNNVVIDSRQLNITHQTAGGNADGYKYKLKVHKTNEQGEPLAGTEFEVIRDSVGTVVGKIITDGAGNGEIDGLLKDSYTLRETKAPEGYERLANEIKVTPQDFGTDKQAFKAIVNKKSAQVAITGQKTWKDNNDQDGKRPDKIKVNLLADGKVVATKEVKATEGWKYSFENLPKYENGKAIVYTVTEDQVKDYQTTIKGYDITNTHEPAKTKVSGQKTWKDNDDQDGKRPDKIKVNLLADGKVVATKEVKATEGWKYSFENLPKYQNGREIVYTVTEDQVKDYQTTIKGYDITNSYTPGKTSVSVTKAWEDNNDQDGLRPQSIKVQLYADGQAKGGPVTLDAKNNWRYTWNDLAQKQKGKTVVYTVKEVGTVTGYTTQTDASNLSDIKITNTHEPAKTKVSGQKTWKDNDDQDGKRPDKIKVNLLADGKVVATKEVKATEGWKYSFENLPKYQNGREIVYTVTEDQVKDYQTTIKGYDITNTHEPAKTKVVGQKTWKDNDDQDGKRPDEIKVNLLADGKVVATKEVKATEGWKYSFENLPKYENGKAIVYTVTEDQVKDYQTTIKGYDITNSYTPGKTSVSVTKAWEDNNDQDGLRPQNIKVQLYADGQAKGGPVTLDAKNNWRYTWNDLAQKQKGKAIVYTVKELTQVKGYTTTINAADQGNIIITNSHTSATPEPNDPKDDGEKTKPEQKTETDRPERAEDLPKTGEKTFVALSVLGGIFLLIAGIILYKRAKS